MTDAKRRPFLLSAAPAAALAGMRAQPALAADGGNAPHIPVRPSDRYEGLSIDVRAFGAKGDGATDDTAAIRAAVQAAFERRRVPQHSEYGYFGTGLPEHLLPYQVNEVLAEAPPRKGHWRRGRVIRNLNLEGHHTKAGYVRSTVPAEDQPYG